MPLPPLPLELFQKIIQFGSGILPFDDLVLQRGDGVNPKSARKKGTFGPKTLFLALFNLILVLFC